MDKLTVTCLGSGAALARDRLWSSLLLDERILFSLPPTAVSQLHRLGRDPTAISHIFISHRHADHFFGLPFLLLYYSYLYSRDEPLYIIGPAGMQEATQCLFDLAWPDLKERGIEPSVPIIYVEVKMDGWFQAGEIEFQALRMEHFSMVSYGYRFRYKGRDIAFTGDTGDCPQLCRLVDGANVVITEFTHPRPSTDPGHMDATAVSSLAQKLRTKGVSVLATHLEGEPTKIDGVTICHDGETYQV